MIKNEYRAPETEEGVDELADTLARTFFDSRDFWQWAGCGDKRAKRMSDGAGFFCSYLMYASPINIEAERDHFEISFGPFSAKIGRKELRSLIEYCIPSDDDLEDDDAFDRHIADSRIRVKASFGRMNDDWGA